MNSSSAAYLHISSLTARLAHFQGTTQFPALPFLLKPFPYINAFPMVFIWISFYKPVFRHVGVSDLFPLKDLLLRFVRTVGALSQFEPLPLHLRGFNLPLSPILCLLDLV